jgi:hypothetical protein
VDTITRTRDEVIRDLSALATEAGRMPKHYVDRKAVIHKRIDALLYELQAVDAPAE